MKRYILTLAILLAALTASAQGRRVTIKQFLKMSPDDTTTCIISGVVKSVRNPISGNLYLKDRTGQVLVYGIKDAPGGTRTFVEMGVLPGDSLSLVGRRHVFNGTVIEMKDAWVLRYAPGPKHDKIVEQRRSEKSPLFKGKGVEYFCEWVQAHIRYPAEAKAEGIQGTVTISFAVGRNGKVQEVLVEKGVHPLLDAEAKRVVSSSPKWKPAKRNGRAVRTALQIDVVFEL